MNSDTTHRIGEAYRVQSFEGGDDYQDLAQKAMTWYERGWKINPLDGANYARYGMCLDWIGRHEEAAAYFNKADEMEPNSFHTAANVGWHYVQVRNYAAARISFQRSVLLESVGNQLAGSLICRFASNGSLLRPTPTIHCDCLSYGKNGCFILA